ncbi:hypothetical protein BXO88_04770 [Oribacterium sp. C9]|nr:hypothetical protein BXO88_04770 [Oribacterium sp. C9]
MAFIAGICFTLNNIPLQNINSTTFYEVLYKDDMLTGFHSFLYRLLGKNEINNFSVVRDKDGYLYHANFWNNTDISMKDAAQKIRALQDIFRNEETGEVGTKVVVLMFPSKYDKQRSRGYEGLPYPDMNEYADDLLQYLRRYSVDYIDYRKWLKDSGRSSADMFYLSDSHWKVNTAFYATVYLAEYIKYRYGLDLDPDHIYLNSDNYLRTLYEELFYGDYALKTERYHTKADSYELIIPGFDTDFSTVSESPGGRIVREQGLFSEVLTTRRYINEKNEYEKEVYKTYLGSLHARFHIENLLNPEGPKFLFMWNVWSPEVAAFTSSMAGTVDSLNIEYMDDARIKKELSENTYDYIFIGLHPDSLDIKHFPYDFKTKERQDNNE